MDVSAIVLNKLLAGRDLDAWARIKLVYIDPAYSSLYSAIAKYYDKYSSIPSFEDLEITLRDGPARRSLAAVKLASNDDISIDVALDALIDQYTQNETVRLLDKFIDKLPVFDTAEIKEALSGIVLTLDEKTLQTGGVFGMSDMLFFRNHDELARERVFLGFNNKFDAALSGVARQELILVGGKRGSGKSITCSNIQVNQYEAGYTCPYFTIEMIAQETLERNIAILAQVSHSNIKKGTLTDAEVLRIVKARAGMFVDADDLVKEFERTRDRFQFESRLVREKSLKPDNQMIIIDDRNLSLTSLDLHLGKIKAKFGDKFRVAVVDYLNQVVVDASASIAGQFEWMQQVIIAKKLKELARKYDIVMFAPYQIDDKGEARFAKGILDAADIAMVMDAVKEGEPHIGFSTTKIRGGADIKCASPIDWETLRISPVNIDVKPATAKEEKKQSKKEDVKQDDSGSDLPPW